jgi:hypothetical protein
MDIISKISVAIVPILLTIIGFLLVQLFIKINGNVKDVKSDVKDFRDNITLEISNLRSDIGSALNNTGILSEEILSIEEKCKIRHKE